MPHFLEDLPRLFPRPEQTIAGIGPLLRAGEVSCVDILNACLEQVDRWESKVHAWVVLDRDGAMAQARALDEELRSGKDRGPLHGIPFGVKDIFDVKGLPTACGMARWADRIADTDADPVGVMRNAGAVIMGKTVTTACAWIDPPPTRNPWNLERTPGGSSSGSAAAVATGMCYAALGSQTGGSVTRPASFCGIAGIKPSREIAWMNGHENIYPMTWSLDHLGFLARGVGDIAILFDTARNWFLDKQWLYNKREGTERAPRFRHPDRPPGPPRFARLRGFFDRRAEPAVRSAIDAATAALVASGAQICDIEDPVDFDQILADHRSVMSTEAALGHQADFDQFPDDFPPRIADLIREGRLVRATDYIRATRSMERTRLSLMFAMVDVRADAIITPATVGTAPDPTTTGDPAFNSPWSYTGLPTVSFPVGLAANGLPVAVQLVGNSMWEDDLIRAAASFEAVVRSHHA